MSGRNALSRLFRGSWFAAGCGLWILGLCGGAFEARALVDANSPGNTNAPSDGVPWANLGRVNGSGGIYLGNGWVLTPVHVGPGNVDFDGTIVAWDGTSKQLTNSDGSGADMMLFHLGALPVLPNLALASSTPPALSTNDMIGFGFIAGSVQTSLGAYSGFDWSAIQFKSWGNNRVNTGPVTMQNDGIGNNASFMMDFTSPLTPGQTSDEAQAAPGDSGGGVFYKNPSGWELSGMIYAIDTLPSQPGNTAVYGDITYAADIATYRSQILSIAAQTPAVSISSSGTNVLLCWMDTGVSYSLQTTPTLQPTSWAIITPSTFPTNGDICAQLPATNSARFFRLSHP
ncbi:MAG TPA: hypothetical protein VG146_02470 [Verrucomicrobiae bacterium]|nr:hypothetical protein [Verrucomicrobiae bacterium]